MVAIVLDKTGNVFPIAAVQYFFEGGIEVPVNLDKHRNAKKEDASPYM